ncbi:MAG: hydrolase, partial [Cyclobacteriaceae bacterium]|nr:hydrolase [Cyclobacteriaceae bacterium]
GKLAGLEDIKAKNKVEIKPYISGGTELTENNSWDSRIRVGGDINYDITPMLKLNLTINTDFAQVEVDRAQINLSRFSLYYPEKRQFFLEGRDNFQMDMGRGNEVFYSRRIGIHEGEEVPIIAGVRMFGK